MVVASFGSTILNLLLGLVLLAAIAASVLAVMSLAGVFEFAVPMTNQPGWHRALTTRELALILLVAVFIAIVAFGAMWKISVS